MEKQTGFTGTRRGMTKRQQQVLARMLYARAGGFHHGLCVGADAEAHELAYLAALDIIGHPPIVTEHKAEISSTTFKMMREPKTHFARNRDIVNETDELIAAPFVGTHPGHGGTWYTVDYAVKVKKPVTIIWPDGKIATR